MFYRFPRSIKFLILKHKKGHWSFAKGHKDKGETDFQTAKRELLEETGIKKVEFLTKKLLLRESYYYRGSNKEKVRKKVEYYIAESKTKNVKIDGKEITNFRWCTLRTGKRLITYKESRKLLLKAGKIILKTRKKVKQQT